MELLQLKYFMTVAKYQNMTKAAEELFVAQPAVSQSISRLEKEFNVKLFDRVGKTIQLNKYGNTLLKYSEIIFKNIDELQNELNIIRDMGDNRILIAAWPNSVAIPKLLTVFNEQYPYINIEITDNPNDSNCDFYFSTSAYGEIPYPCDILFQEKLLLGMSIDHPLARYDSIPLSLACSEPFIMQPRSKPYRQICETFCKLAGFQPNTKYEIDSFQTTCKLLNMNQGIAFIPEHSWGNIDFPGIKYLKVEQPVCLRTIYLSWEKERIFSTADEIFRSFAHAYYQNSY